MTNAPHLLVEGMILGGLVTGARHGIIYIRHEYERPGSRSSSTRSTAATRGRHARAPTSWAPGCAFELEIVRQPGRLHLRRGERAARGDRGQARRAAQQAAVPRPRTGLCGKPTVINNVETFVVRPGRSWRTGLDWFKAQGKNGVGRCQVRRRQRRRRAARASSKCRWARRHRELIEDLAGGVAGGRTLKACAPSGPSGGYLPASMLDLPLDWNVDDRGGLDRSARARSSSATTAPACSTWRSTPCASSATSRAASACPAGSARPSWSTCSAEMDAR